MTRDYECAIADDMDDEAVDAAINWVEERRGSGETIAIWAPSLRQARGDGVHRLIQVLAGSRNVEPVAKRNAPARYRGPVLALYPSASALSDIERTRGITALCVVTGSQSLDSWARESGAIRLDHKAFSDAAPGMPPTALDSLDYLTGAVPLHKTISAGDEKYLVITELRTLHGDIGTLPARAMGEWAAANGWGDKNSRILTEYAEGVNNGKNYRL